MVLLYVPALLERYAPALLFGISPEIITIGGSLAAALTVIPMAFRLSAKVLDLDIRDYLKPADVSFPRMISLTCMGMAIYMTALTLASLLSVFAKTGTLSYSFLGRFSSREFVTANILYFLLYVIVKPVCDEYIFRGIIQRQLGHYNRHFGIVASALLYALAQPSLPQAVPCLALGWYLSQLTIRFHSIRPGITIHILIMLFLWALEISPRGMLVLFILLIVLIYCVAGLNFFQRQLYGHILRPSGSEEKFWGILFSSTPVVICAVLFLTGVLLSFL